MDPETSKKKENGPAETVNEAQESQDTEEKRRENNESGEQHRLEGNEESPEEVPKMESEKKLNEAVIEKKPEGEAEESEESFSDDSEGSADVDEELRDMFDDSEGSEEELEEEGEIEEEEELEEEEDLTEWQTELKQKYMTGDGIEQAYLEKVNQRIEEVTSQIFAIEFYITHVRTLYGYSNHWLRLKVLDSPCFEIYPCTNVQAQASLWGNRSQRGSKGSHPVEYSNIKRIVENEEIHEEIKDEEERSDKESDKRVVLDLKGLSPEERKRTIEDMMTAKTPSTRISNEWSKSNLKIQSVERWEDVSLMDLASTGKREKEPVWIMKEPFENGKTVLFPMKPYQLIHQLQRQPLNIFVSSSTGFNSAASMSMSWLSEVVIRASKGPPYPLSSTKMLNIVTSGDFAAKVSGTIRFIALGPEHVSLVKANDNPNDQLPPTIPKERPPPINCNMDIHQMTPILTGPQSFTLYDVLKNVRAKRRAEMFQPPQPPMAPKCYVDDLVFNRQANTVVRAPKKTYASLRAEIDRYLVLNKTKVQEESEESESSISTVEEEDELKNWIACGGEEEEEEEEELGDEDRPEDEDDDNDEEKETSTQRVDAVFQSLLQSYAGMWPSGTFSSTSSKDSSSSSSRTR